jgi:hypothetical protein
VGVSSPAMMDSSVLLPEPEAPTMATVSRGARLKSISRRISSVPVESVTDLNMLHRDDGRASRAGRMSADRSVM